MLVVFFLLWAFLLPFGEGFGGQDASFDLSDPEAARARYAEITAIEGFSEQGRAWCSLTEAEVRAIARHTEISNIITTTTHTSSSGEVTSSAVIEPAPNQDELVEREVEYLADSCRYNVWATLEKLQTISDQGELAELMCQITEEEAATLLRFLSGGYTEVIEVATSSDGSSTETKISSPPEQDDENGMTAWMEALSAGCGKDGG